MSCQEFEQIAGELAEDRLMSAKARVSALAHAETCERCARRLGNERMLTNRLGVLAESTASESPARVKQSLRAAFDAQLLSSEAKIVAATNLVHFPVKTRQWRLVFAAAAAITILFAVAVSVWMRSQSPKSIDLVSTATPSPTVIPAATTPETAETLPANRVEVKNAAVPKLPVLSRRRIQTMEEELAASYIPLTYSTNSGAPQDKLVVRVEVSRSTLIGMGLPLNAEGGNELVKADLMVGVDGVPLAIRFVKAGAQPREQE